MRKILLGGAGGAPTNNVIKSLRDGHHNIRLIGMSAQASDLFLADVDEKHIIPYATQPNYSPELFKIIEKSRPDFLHAQHDFEVRAVSNLREEINQAGVKLFLPNKETVENCIDKEKSYQIWKNNGVPVPSTLKINEEKDLKKAFDKFAGKLWLRATEGGGGTGALPIESMADFEFAKLWIERFKGWGGFTAAELLSANSITWLSIWFEGALVVAQTRRRLNWNFGNRTLSGVTGITGVAETCSLPEVDRIAMDAIQAIDKKPHGIFGVDMTYDYENRPKLTEINIGRFFTTVYFFTKAGVNFPRIYLDIALENEFPNLTKKINPLPNGLVWIRGMDVEPCLTTLEQLKAYQCTPSN